NLTAPIVITAPTGVEISNGGTTFSGTVTLTPTSGRSEERRVGKGISSAAAQGTVTGNITDTSTGATAQNVAVTGTVNAVATPTVTVTPSSLSLGTTTAGTASTAKTFTVSGSNLTAPIVITAPTGVEISNGGTTFSGTVTLTPTSG